MSVFSSTPYHAGRTTLGAGSTWIPILESIFGADFMPDELDRIISMVILYDAPLKIKLNKQEYDEFHLPNPTGVAVPFILNEFFPPAVINIKEIYAKNESTSSCVVDILIIPRVDNVNVGV